MQLAQSNVPVCVYERTNPFAPPERTLIVTPELTRVLGFSAAPATLNKVHTLELCSNARAVPITLRDPDLIVERRALLRQLETYAIRAGVQIEYGLEFTGFVDTSGTTHVELRHRASQSTHCVAAHAVIAADGVRSHVARALGAPALPTVTVLQARIATTGVADPGVGKVWFLPDDSPYFYWLCPESARNAAVGLVDVCPGQARQRLDTFLAARGWEPLEYQSALVPLYTPKTVVSRRAGQLEVLFAGDAAGQVKVTTIGGTVSSLLGAQAAARAIVNGTPYTHELKGVDRELRLHWYIRRLMLHFRDTEYDVLLQLLSGRVGRLLEIHNRDRLASVFWSMLAMQPRLPLLAAQVLWRTGLGA